MKRVGDTHSNRGAIERLVAWTFEAERQARALITVVDVHIESELARISATRPKVDLDSICPYDEHAA